LYILAILSPPPPPFLLPLFSPFPAPPSVVVVCCTWFFRVVNILSFYFDLHTNHPIVQVFALDFAFRPASPLSCLIPPTPPPPPPPPTPAVADPNVYWRQKFVEKTFVPVRHQKHFKRPSTGQSTSKRISRVRPRSAVGHRVRGEEPGASERVRKERSNRFVCFVFVSLFRFF
jgi:hypothetical protein